MLIREQDKHFLWSLYAGIAIILIWKGIWEGAYEIVPEYIADPFVFLFIGFLMLTISGLIFKEFDPLGSIDVAVQKTIDNVQSHPEKEKFVLKYYDKAQKKYMKVDVVDIVKVEKGALVLKLKNKKQEMFIPINRVSEILYKGKHYWKL